MKYEGYTAEKIFRNFETFRQVFEEEVKVLEDEFLEILEFCVDEAIEKMNEKLSGP
jgi:hypothetical protein